MPLMTTVVALITRETVAVETAEMSYCRSRVHFAAPRNIRRHKPVRDVAGLQLQYSRD